MFNFEKDIVLENDVVQMRPLRKDDTKHLLIFSENEPDLWKFSLTSACGTENLGTYIDAALKARNEEKEYPFIIFDKKTNSYAGSSRFYDFQLNHQTVLIGYTWIGKAYHGTGLNKNCKYLMLSYAFENLNMKRVEFRADINNEKSIRAMKSIGCKEEGILRNHLHLPDEKRRSSIVLSILEEEWYGGVKEKIYKDCGLLEL